MISGTGASRPASRSLETLLRARPSGLTVDDIASELGITVETAGAMADGQLSAGKIERWPFWPERLRATEHADDPYLAALATLRGLARPRLADLNYLSRAPATLHLLVPEGQLVIDRYPSIAPAEDVAREQSTYGHARGFNSGATAMVLRAWMPDTALAPPDADQIRADGYCLRMGGKTTGSWVLSAALRDERGSPYAALCTYGMEEAVPVSQAREAAPAVAEVARQFPCPPSLEPLKVRAREICRSLKIATDGHIGYASISS